MIKYQCKIVGTTPLVMHRGGLVDPLDEFTKRIKRISKKRNKTESDLEELAHLEFLGGLYTEDGKVIIPRTVFKATMRDAGKKYKRGKDVTKGVRIQNNFILDYPGPDDPEELWKDKKFRLTVPCKVQQAKIMRTRPMFPEWSAKVEVYFDEAIFNEEEIAQIIEEAGNGCFLMEWFGEYGGFSVEK